MQNFLSFHQSFTDAYQVIESHSILIFDGLVSVSFHSPGLSIAFEHGLCKDGASSNQAPVADVLLASAPWLWEGKIVCYK